MFFILQTLFCSASPRKRPQGVPKGGAGRRKALCLAVILALLLCLGGREGEDDVRHALFGREARESVRVYLDGETVRTPLEEYLAHVVSAEMPEDYPEEALKAQAVAARTYTLYKRANGGCARHPEADVCVDAACCQAWRREVLAAARWAVEATRGEYLKYQDEAILAVYHACAGGRTEDVEQVFSQSMPYLRGVESPGEEEAPQYRSRAFFTRAQLSSLLGAEADEVRILERSESGRVRSARVGEQVFSGTRLRALLSLPSTRFSVSETEEGWLFEATGSGHGVGMSQVGAAAMARRGSGYREILTWYYTGVDFGALAGS